MLDTGLPLCCAGAVLQMEWMDEFRMDGWLEQDQTEVARNTVIHIVILLQTTLKDLLERYFE